MVKNHYRWDFVGLSTDTKPTPENSEKVTNGSTYYCSDTSKLYVWCDTQWYERKPLGGGGGGGGSYTAGTGIDITNDTISVDTDTIQEKLTAGTNITIDNNVISSTGGGSVTPVQTTGTSTTDVMSQNATTSMVFADPATQRKIKIGAGTFASVGDNAIEIGKESKAKGVGTVAVGSEATVDSLASYGMAIGVNTITFGDNAIAIGYSSSTNNEKAVALGRSAQANHSFSVALGAGATTSVAGEINVGTGSIYPTKGFNSTNYRLISGVHDPVNAHDAATKGYVDSHAGGGAVTELTADDYDLTIGQYEGIALWRLEAGLYHTGNNVQAFAGNDADFRLSLNSHLIIIDDSGNQKLIKVVGDDFSASSSGVYKGFVQYKIAASDGSGTYAQSDSVVSSATLMIKRNVTPTSSDVGFAGQLWYDTANNKLYINVNRPSDYTGNWKEIQLVS